MPPLAPDSNMPVGPALFITGAVKPAGFPPADRPEIAVAGRSNVGKSSLINKLLRRKGLARTSRTPGRTQQINFFDVAGWLYLADLPGFGYAQVPLAVRAAWRPLVEGYLSARRDLRLILLLVDIRRDPGQEELDLLAWLATRSMPALVVVTKADKLSRSQGLNRMAVLRRDYGLSTPPLAFSATTGQGRDELWAAVLEACRPQNITPAEPTPETT